MICGAVDAEEDVAAEAVAEASDDAVAGVRHRVGIEDGEFSIVVLREHGVSGEAQGEGVGIADGEGEVFGGGEGGLSRGGEFARSGDGEDGQGGDAWCAVHGGSRNGEGRSVCHNWSGYWLRGWGGSAAAVMYCRRSRGG